MQTPLLDPTRTPKHMPSDVSNRNPLLPYYKTYAVYAAGREPAEYLERLRRVDPEIIANLTGETVFDAPRSFRTRTRAWSILNRLPPPAFRSLRTAPTRSSATSFARRVSWNSAEIPAPGVTQGWCLMAAS
jgi:hypothetical protein